MLSLRFAHGQPPFDPRESREVNAWRDGHERTFARAFVSGSSRCIDWFSLGVFACTPGSLTVTVWPHADVDRKALQLQFERWLQPVLLQALGWQTLHASGVRRADRTIAFCGLKGAGKSTTTYAMRHAGWTQIADDALVVNVERDAVCAHALPFTPRFWESSFKHFAGDRGTLPFVDQHFDSSTSPLSAIFLLSQFSDDRPTAVERVPLAKAFADLLLHAHAFDTVEESSSRKLVEDYFAIAERVPVFTLCYYPDFSRMPALIQTIESVVDDVANSSAGRCSPLAAR